jgi:hypothetical protein
MAGMLAEFIREQDLDIIYFKELTTSDELKICDNETNLNIWTSIRGSAILVKSQYHLTDILI